MEVRYLNNSFYLYIGKQDVWKCLYGLVKY